MTASEIEELRDMIHRHFEATGMRATHSELMADMTVPAHIAQYLIKKGLSGQITSYFSKRRDDGLPFAPVVNADNEHVPLDLAEFEEIEYFVNGCIRRGDAEYAQARRGAALARERYGREIVVPGVDLSEGVAA